MSKRGLVCGWGVNDSNSPVGWYEMVNGRRIRKVCPVYQDWRDMIRRAKSDYEKSRHETYRTVQADERFRHFSDFKNWVLNIQPNKDWQNCELDKDLFSKDVKLYSPETAVYLPKTINILLLNSQGSRGEYLLGVYFEKETQKFRACCQNPFTGKNDKLGRFETELEAHKAWQTKKHEHATTLADTANDPRVADALRQRYAPDKDWTKA